MKKKKKNEAKTITTAQARNEHQSPRMMERTSWHIQRHMRAIRMTMSIPDSYLVECERSLRLEQLDGAVDGAAELGNVGGAAGNGRGRGTRGHHARLEDHSDKSIADKSYRCVQRQQSNNLRVGIGMDETL